MFFLDDIIGIFSGMGSQRDSRDVPEVQSVEEVDDTSDDSVIALSPRETPQRQERVIYQARRGVRVSRRRNRSNRSNRSAQSERSSGTSRSRSRHREDFDDYFTSMVLSMNQHSLISNPDFNQAQRLLEHMAASNGFTPYQDPSLVYGYADIDSMEYEEILELIEQNGDVISKGADERTIALLPTETFNAESGGKEKSYVMF